MISITDDWQKETKTLPNGDVLTLLKDGRRLMRITNTNPDGNVDNESWSLVGCTALEEACEMKFFEPVYCATEEQLRRWFNDGDSTFCDNPL